MTVFIAYARDNPRGMRVFSTRKRAERFAASLFWPRNIVIHTRKVNR